MEIDLEDAGVVKEIMDMFVGYSNVWELYIEQLSSGNYLDMKKPEWSEGALQPLPVRSYAGPIEKNGHHELVEIKSSVIGTFTLGYRDQEEKIKKGDLVTKRQILGNILHLKDVLEEIESPCAGQIVEILVEDGDTIEYGQLLFKIQETT